MPGLFQCRNSMVLYNFQGTLVPTSTLRVIHGQGVAGVCHTDATHRGRGGQLEWRRGADGQYASGGAGEGGAVRGAWEGCDFDSSMSGFAPNHFLKDSKWFFEFSDSKNIIEISG